MKNRGLICLLATALMGGGMVSCKEPSEEDRLLSSITDEFLSQQVLSNTDDIAQGAIKDQPLDASTLNQRRITCVEVTHLNATQLWQPSDTKVAYQDDTIRPESRAMITGLPNSRQAGMFIPRDPKSALVELRINYHFGTNGHVAVHIVTERPNKAIKPYR